MFYSFPHFYPHKYPCTLFHFPLMFNLIFSAYSLHLYYSLTFFSFSNFILVSHLFHIKLLLLFFHFHILSFALSHVYKFLFSQSLVFSLPLTFYSITGYTLFLYLFSIFSFPVLCSFTFILYLFLLTFSPILFSITFPSHTFSQFLCHTSPSHF